MAGCLIVVASNCSVSTCSVEGLDHLWHLGASVSVIGFAQLAGLVAWWDLQWDSTWVIDVIDFGESRFGECRDFGSATWGFGICLYLVARNALSQTDKSNIDRTSLPIYRCSNKPHKPLKWNHKTAWSTAGREPSFLLTFVRRLQALNAGPEAAESNGFTESSLQATVWKKEHLYRWINTVPKNWKNIRMQLIQEAQINLTTLLGEAFETRRSSQLMPRCSWRRLGTCEMPAVSPWTSTSGCRRRGKSERSFKSCWTFIAA